MAGQYTIPRQGRRVKPLVVITGAADRLGSLLAEARLEDYRVVGLDRPGRIQGRRGHFFKPELLASQYSDLDEPEHAVVVDATQSAEAVMDEVIDKLDVHHPKPNDQAQ